MGILWTSKSEIVGEVTDTLRKEWDYRQSEGRNQYAGIFSLPALNINWTNWKSYAERADAIYRNSVAKTCVERRARSIGNIDIKYEGGNKAVEALLKRPNVRDGDLGTFLNNSEVSLSVGGDLDLFWDMRLPSTPMVHAFRQDLVVDDVENSRFLYAPHGVTDGKKPQFIFEYDNLGKTTRALQLVGDSYKVIRGGFQKISYFDPRTSSEGAGAGDSALTAIDIMNAIDKLLHSKFKAGGTKAGFFQLSGEPTDAEIEKMRSQFAALNPDGGSTVLPAGVTFNDAQLTLAEMEVLEARNQMAKEICTAFQVPAELVNESEATYANARGKDKIFYRNFIGPEAHWLVGQLQTGIRLYVDPNAELAVDETSVQHLEEDRLERASKMAQMKCFTPDEIRAVMGYEPAEEDAQFVGAQVNMGQPEEKPKGEVAFDADAGDRGDDNDN
ncbi:MAG: hypothetical protein BGP16_00920 [Sphingobium sp. 66-54]|nr:MAG: hypothetical protein BGP16_00920 [Sphingobium sp. 66-54]